MEMTKANSIEYSDAVGFRAYKKGVRLMNSSMKDCLKVVEPHFSPDLISTETLSDIYTLAEILPPVSDAVLECRLGASASRVDLSVFLTKPTINLPDTILIHPVWRRFQDLCQDLADANSSLHQGVSEIWLEFDVDGQPSKVPIPCVFLGLDREAACNAQSLLEIALKLLEHRASSHLESNLHLCLDALPTDAKIIFIGAMLSRQSDAVRVIVRGIPPAQLSAYLTHIGWTGSVNELEEVISPLSGLVDNIIPSFDVGDTVFSRIGLECYLTNLPQHEPRWQLFLDHLVTTGLCTPAKRNALLAWPGYDQKAFFGRFITHIKIVCQPGIPLEAKGYLGLWHRLNQFPQISRTKSIVTETL